MKQRNDLCCSVAASVCFCVFYEQDFCIFLRKKKRTINFLVESWFSQLKNLSTKNNFLVSSYNDNSAGRPSTK